MGLLMRAFGMTIDNFLSAQLVLADGSVVTASTEENQEFFGLFEVVAAILASFAASH